MFPNDDARSVGRLQGVRILDLTRLLPGDYCTLLMADMGAEVIKVEDLPQGDYVRWMPPLVGRYGAYFHALNAGKKSIGLNLKSEDGRRVFLKIAERCDVLIESFRPGVMASLGVDYATVQKVQPRIIYCSLTGYGQSGPYRSRAGHDVNYVGLAGLLTPPRAAENDAEPAHDLPRAAVADIGGSYAAAFSIAAALYARHQSGHGAYLDIALTEAALTFAIPRLVRAACMQAGQPIPALQGEELSGSFACYNIYRTADGKYVTLGAREPKFWKAFLTVAGRHDLLEAQYDPSRQAELTRIVAGIFLERPQKEWLELLGEKADACCEPLQEGSEVLRHPQLQARQLFSYNSVGDSSVLQVATPSGTRPPRRPPAPGYGEHTAEVLAACGFSHDEIAQLSQAGVVLLQDCHNAP